MDKKHKTVSAENTTPPGEHKDEDSVDADYNAKDYPIMEHMSNARLMPMTGPYGRLDLDDTYEYGSVPEDPSTPMESYETIMEKNTEKK